MVFVPECVPEREARVSVWVRLSSRLCPGNRPGQSKSWVNCKSLQISRKRKPRRWLDLDGLAGSGQGGRKSSPHAIAIPCLRGAAQLSMLQNIILANKSSCSKYSHTHILAPCHKRIASPGRILNVSVPVSVCIKENYIEITKSLCRVAGRGVKIVECGYSKIGRQQGWGRSWLEYFS